jgi:hypothetical protein
MVPGVGFPALRSLGLRLRNVTPGLRGFQGMQGPSCANPLPLTE